MLGETELEKISSVFKKESTILAAYLFGSYVGGSPHKYSDIDIAVLFDKMVNPEDYTDKQIDLAVNLGRLLGREADVVVLNRAGSFLKYNVLKNGLRVYERADRNERGFEARAIVEYFDFLPIKNRIEEGILSKINKAA
ncbi:MAG: nucleotidyltransferase domain-containing protein [Candidatus Omnitrophota bacterium]